MQSAATLQSRAAAQHELSLTIRSSHDGFHLLLAQFLSLKSFLVFPAHSKSTARAREHQWSLALQPNALLID